MTEAAKVGFLKDFRRFFLRGLATLLPTIVTIVLLFKCYEFIQNNISVHITEGIIRIVVATTDNYPKIERFTDEEKSRFLDVRKPGASINDPEIIAFLSKPETKDEMRLWRLRQEWHHGPRSLVGFGIAIILVYVVGRLLASFIGRRVWQLFERTVQQVPLFKQVYPYIKQVTDFLFGENKIEFTRVVMVEYPRMGIWSMGLVTGAGFKHVKEATHQDTLSVFIPSSPTPVTGYVITVNKNDVIDLPISIEEALRFTVSGGVIVPERQALPTQRVELASGPAGQDKNDTSQKAPRES